MNKFPWVVFAHSIGCGHNAEFYFVRNGEDGIPVVIDGCLTEYKRAVEYVDWLNKKDGVVVIPGLWQKEAHIIVP